MPQMVSKAYAVTSVTTAMPWVDCTALRPAHGLYSKLWCNLAALVPMSFAPSIQNASFSHTHNNERYQDLFFSVASLLLVRLAFGSEPVCDPVSAALAFPLSL